MEIAVIYKNGVFKPLKKVNLKEGVRGKIKITSEELERLRGKYAGKINYNEETDEIHDRRDHFS
ncbi:MAG: antitoxin family protein [Candidatus Methanofastidiosia archaeon]|jgi:predicted DNA-binding antitoxin AbrB/MazE fold protein